jgi:hypothetical protein
MGNGEEEFVILGDEDGEKKEDEMRDVKVQFVAFPNWKYVAR